VSKEDAFDTWDYGMVCGINEESGKGGIKNNSGMGSIIKD
jgi:hypothetical protein